MKKTNEKNEENMFGAAYFWRHVFIRGSGWDCFERIKAELPRFLDQFANPFLNEADLGDEIIKCDIGRDE